MSWSWYFYIKSNQILCMCLWLCILHFSFNGSSNLLNTWVVLYFWGPEDVLCWIWSQLDCWSSYFFWFFFLVTNFPCQLSGLFYHKGQNRGALQVSGVAGLSVVEIALVIRDQLSCEQLLAWPLHVKWYCPIIYSIIAGYVKTKKSFTLFV